MYRLNAMNKCSMVTFFQPNQCFIYSIWIEEISVWDHSYVLKIIVILSLRVWSDWTIENNKFTAMNMIEGSRCGEGRQRSTKVGAQKEEEQCDLFSGEPSVLLTHFSSLVSILCHIECQQ